MIHDSVENVDAFVEKYIYEYRGFLFRIHTWRQIEVLSVWFAGILAALGTSVHYLSSGLTETVYQYIAAGIAEMVLLSVVMRLSDEPYKINAVKMYMVDYLENICAFRLKKQNQRERESIDVIAAENGGKNGFQPLPDARGQEEGTRKRVRTGRTAQAGAQSAAQAGSPAGAQQDAQSVIQSATQLSAQSETQPEQAVYASHGSRGEAAGTVKAGGDQVSAAARGTREESLPINIEGEPRAAERSGLAGQALHSAENNTDSDRTALREEAIRQILEEFLA